MRNFLLASFLIFITSSALANPFYQPDQKPVVYDVSYNIALRNKLEADYFKKCFKQVSPNESRQICGTNSYAKQVVQKYDLLKKPDDYKIISK